MNFALPKDSLLTLPQRLGFCPFRYRRYQIVSDEPLLYVRV